MTPTEQDKLSIEEKVSVILDVLIGHHLCPADENDQNCLLNISTKEISQLITAHFTDKLKNLPEMQFLPEEERTAILKSWEDSDAWRQLVTKGVQDGVQDEHKGVVQK